MIRSSQTKLINYLRAIAFCKLPVPHNVSKLQFIDEELKRYNKKYGTELDIKDLNLPDTLKLISCKDIDNYFDKF